jgi:copper chaperone CopZ
MFQSKHRIKVLIVLSFLIGWLLVTKLSGANLNSFFKPDMEVRVNGLVCSICAAGLKKSFEKHTSVEGVKIDIKKSIMLIDFSTGKDGRILYIKNKDVIKMVRKTGYEVESIKILADRKPNRYNKP